MMQISENESWPYDAVRYWMGKYKIKTRPRDEACYYGYWHKHSNGKSIPPYTQGRKLILEELKNLYYKRGIALKK